MNQAIRFVAALPGVLFGFQGLLWVFAPARAAEGLGMPLLDGIARSTLIGDLSTFFFAMSAMILVGVVRREPRWLRAAGLFVGVAAVMRTLAWALQGADFASEFIAIEVGTAALLFFAASRIRSD